eukprot:g4429.t1
MTEKSSAQDYPRDLIGYGQNPPRFELPEGARIALQFVLNYEEGGENSVLHGDAHSETFLSEIIGAKAYADRHMSMESLYEYGSRSGFWRIQRLFTERGLPLTIFGVATALMRNPAAVKAMLDADWEIACHGLKWIDHQHMAIDEERAQIKQAIQIHTEVTGTEPLGWYTGRDSPNTRDLVLAEGGFRYDSDSYADDLPYWVKNPHDQDAPHLVIPYTLDTNDMRFASPQGFNSGDQFYSYLKDAFDVLYEEGGKTPKLLNVGLHCRIIGQGEYGLAARKTLVDQIRREVESNGGYTLLLSGGDINTGVPESDTQDAEPDFKGMSIVGYDAMAVGNHEFDNSLPTIRQQEAWSSFPFLSANIFDDQGSRLFAPYKLFEFGDLSVAVIGFTTHRTSFIGNPQHIQGLRFSLPEEAAPAVLQELPIDRDMTIALTHIGHHQGDIGTDISLAAAVDGLDLIVGGHSAEPVCVTADGSLIQEYQPGAPCLPDNVNDTWIVQAHEWGKYVGRADFVVTEQAENTEIELLQYELIPVNLITELDGEPQFAGEYIPPDKPLFELLASYQERGSESLGQQIAVSMDLFDRDDFSQLPNPSPLGALVADAFRVTTGADIAIVNHGGLRDNLYPGNITLKQVLQLAPFGNTVVYVDLTGNELETYLNNLRITPDNPGMWQFIGLQVVDETIIYSETGQPLSAAETYRVATSNFVAMGGDGAPSLVGQDTYVDTGLVDYVAIQDYLANAGTITLDEWN